MFKENLLYIKDDIEKTLALNKDVMKESVQNKLNNSMEIYLKNLDETCHYMLSQETKRNLNLMKLIKTRENN